MCFFVGFFYFFFIFFIIIIFMNCFLSYFWICPKGTCWQGPNCVQYEHANYESLRYYVFLFKLEYIFAGYTLFAFVLFSL